MRVQRIYNQDLLRSVLLKPELWATLQESEGTSPDEFYPDLETNTALALIGEDNALHGFVVFDQTYHSIADTVAALAPEFWGHRDNVALGKLACAEILKTSPRIHKLVASIPVPDKQVLRYYQRLGFQREGINRKSFLRSGTLLDQYYVGKTRD
jgi:RimJ/RimL family protein N-acetyltransferase